MVENTKKDVYRQALVYEMKKSLILQNLSKMFFSHQKQDLNQSNFQ